MPNALAALQQTIDALTREDALGGASRGVVVALRCLEHSKGNSVTEEDVFDMLRAIESRVRDARQVFRVSEVADA